MCCCITLAFRAEFGQNRPMITLNNISARIAGRLLIDQANLALPAGIKAGFVGKNGAGKSTLFKIITGDMESETGSVSIPKNARIGQVAPFFILISGAILPLAVVLYLLTTTTWSTAENALLRRGLPA